MSAPKPPPTLVICSKSGWTPAIRREHALARSAAAAGHRVLVIEQPQDVRALAAPGRRAWLAQLAGLGRARTAEPGIEAVARATLAPAHRGGLAWGVESALLRRMLRRHRADAEVTVVVTTPWHWDATAGLPGTRRVFDCADDWSALLPRRTGRLRESYRRIGREADARVSVDEARPDSVADCVSV